MNICARTPQWPGLSVAHPARQQTETADDADIDRPPNLAWRILDTLDDGLILTDGTARVLHANAPARAIFTAGPLKIHRDQICAPTCAGTRALQDLIRACAGGCLDSATFNARGETARDNALLFITAAEGSITSGRSVIILVRKLDGLTLPSAAVIRDVFGLTPAEARLAVELMNGDGLKPCARRLDVTPSTARTHLRHVFEKTGTKRQAELVRLLLSCRLPGQAPLSIRSSRTRSPTAAAHSSASLARAR